MNFGNPVGNRERHFVVDIRAVEWVVSRQKLPDECLAVTCQNVQLWIFSFLFYVCMKLLTRYTVVDYFLVVNSFD